MFSYLLIIPRCLIFFSYLVFGLCLGFLLSVILGKNWYTQPMGKYIKLIWTKGLAIILGLRIKRQGKPGKEARLIVSNHISWLDIVAIASTQPCVFISKSAVTNWPVVGHIARISGTLFINRQNRKDLYKVMKKGKSAINDGISLVFFPEATTTNGKQIKPFHPSIYQTAIDCNCPTQAIAISYPNRKNKISAAPYIDDDDFIKHLLKVLMSPGIEVSLNYCTPIPTSYNHDRKELAMSTQNQVLKALAL